MHLLFPIFQSSALGLIVVSNRYFKHFNILLKGENYRTVLFSVKYSMYITGSFARIGISRYGYY